MLFTAGKTEISPSEAGYDEKRLEVLHRHFQRIIDAGEIQCAIYCLSRHGKVFAHGAVGKRSFRKDDNTAAAPTDMRWIASITKVFAATAIMKLVEDGHIRLNTGIGEILPQLNTPPFNAINIMHLLTHTSGLHADGGCYENKYQQNYWSTIGNAMKNKKKDFDWISAAMGVAGSGVRKKPGEEWAYCSFGYVLLGEIITRVSGEHCNDYIINNICKPLGMNDTCFDLTPELAKRIITTKKDDEKFINELINGTYKPTDRDKLKIPSTSGGMNGTVRDLIKFGNMFLGHVPEGVRILGRKGIEAMFKPRIHKLPNYCWGANGVERTFCAGFDMRIDEPFLISDEAISHEGAGASALYIDPKEDMVAAWFSPYTETTDWCIKTQFNTINVIWSGLC
ncbi:MAG: beta-lactamase family protein [Defluviitaleaceae bacterium]|nr:beta-lactamase family protein [Defluviitaleaceae bacterium]